ncbi:MAG: cupin domain-containing protein [Paludibacteraceae bacterium]|nr:cupin domain-containing protein [Paludibacteraceae bacterium]
MATEGVTKEQIQFPIGDRIDNPAFTGEAYLKPLIVPDTVFNFPQTNVVTFGPGAHSSWHRHGGMVVLVTDGVGLYQEEGKPAQILRRGDVLQIPAGVRHWHGATPNSRFAHLAAGTNGRSSESRRARSDGRVVTDEDEVNPDRPAVVWTDEMLSKEEYEQLPKE